MSDAIAQCLSEQDAQVVAQAPVLVFLLVSAADGTIDKREIRGFESLLVSDPYRDLLQVMVRVRLSVIDTLRELTEHPVDYLAELQHINRVLGGLPVEQGQRLKRQLYDLGQRVAASSGGIFGLMGNPVSDQEQTALKVIASLFDLEK